MPLESGVAGESQVAVLAGVGLRAIVVDDFMALQTLFEGKALVAVLTGERSILHVCLNVLFVVQPIEINAFTVAAQVSWNFRICVDLFVPIEERGS